MKNVRIEIRAVKIGGVLLAMLAVPVSIRACACGCEVFDVGTSSMFPNGPGGMAFVQYDFQNQNRNWSGTSTARPENNDDKDIKTHFVTVGMQYMFSDKWGAQLEVPFDYRHFKGTDDDGKVATHDWSQLGDIRIEGIYTGFFEDMSAGVTFGLKLPTGSYTEDPHLVDRDTQLGTGSTDILLGGFHRGNFANSERWNWFAQLQADVPALTQAGYRPGVELDTAAGIDYQMLSAGKARISPLAQVIFSQRWHDIGSNADPDNSGYQRILLSPGMELHIHPVQIYADAEFPVYQNFNGNQLAAPVLFKVSVSWMF